VHVGFDASALRPLTTGAEEYQRNLVDALSRSGDDLALTVYTPRSVVAWPPNVRTHEMPWKAGDSAARLVKGAFLLPRRWSLDHLDVLHIPFYYLPLGAPLTSVVTVYDVRFARFPATYRRARLLFLRWAVPQSLRRARRIIAISEFTKREIVEAFDVSPDKIAVTPLAVSSRFQPAAAPEQIAAIRLKYGFRAPFVLCVGTIEPRKNLERTVEAFGRLRRRGTDHILVLAGPPYFGMHRLAATIARLRLEGVVRVIGHVPDEEMPALYSAADVFVYPSLYEGFGIPVLEAMTCGTPVVASNVSSIPEVAGEAAVLFDPRDAEALAGAIEAVLSSAEVTARLRAAGRERAACFTWAETARRTVDAYRQAAGV
jgi:glycosyltransferase involved in cell wall biosynthesis